MQRFSRLANACAKVSRGGASGASLGMVAILLVLSPGAAAQVKRAAVSGQVADATGAVVRGAIVTVRRESVGFERRVEVDAAGHFAVDDLAPGEYIVTATRDGFSIATREVALAGGERSEVTLTLRPGTFTEEVSVIATRIAGTPETVERIPGSVSVIDKAALETSRVFDFSEALRKAPGINVRDEEGFGLRPNIGIRGLNPTRSTKVLLLEDGIPVTYAPYGDNATYYHPPIERFDRIEVLKGSGQVAYGPTTVGGVINYVTPAPPAEPSGAVTLIGGNRDYFNGQVTWGTTWGNTGFLFDYMRKQGESARESVRHGLNDVNLKLVTTLGSNQYLTIKGNYYGEDSKVPYSGLREDEYRANPRQNPFLNDTFDSNRFGASAIHTYVFSGDAVLTTSVYGSYFQRDWWRQSSNSNERPNDSADPNCGGMDNLFTTCGNQGRLRRYSLWGVEPRLTISHDLFGIRNETDLGLRLHYEIQNRVQQNGDGPTSRTGLVVEDNERRNQAYSAFVQNRFLLGKWVITPGLRVERIFYERTNRLASGGAGITGTTDLTQFVPGLGIAYNVAESTTVFAGVHRGFAPPRTEDNINNTTGGAVDLDPELSWNYEVGVRTLPRSGVRLEGTFFRMDYENQVVPASIAGGAGATFTNGGETLHQGLELAGRVDAGTLLKTSHNVYFGAAYTFLPIAEFQGVRFSNIVAFNTVSVSGNRIPYAPEHMLNANVGYAHPIGIHAIVEAVHTSDQFADDLNTVEPSPEGQRGLIPAHTVWNATVNYDVEAIRSTFFVTVKNLFGDTFIVDRSRGLLPSSPRLVQAGLKFNF
jgi:Fe(3+) dicitrate transport protein